MKRKRRFVAVRVGHATIAFWLTVHGAVKLIVPGGPAFSDTCAVWVYFNDKPFDSQYDAVAVSPRALARRRAAGFTGKEYADRAIDLRYIRAVESAGGRLRNCFKWENAASFDLPVDALRDVGRLPFVNRIEFVGKYRKKRGAYPAKLSYPLVSAAQGYGALYKSLAMLEIPWAHLYLKCLHPDDPPGKGVRIALFDSGFRLRHRCFDHLHRRGAVKGTRDFVDCDTGVADPDSVVSNRKHPLWNNDIHGSEVLSIVAAYDPPYYCGCAWGAEFLLARTEDAYYDSTKGLEHELHLEEDNWAAAVVWAESLGVDIISSSLGYRYDFQDTVIIERGGGVFDTIVDYPKDYLDGHTTIVSRAARGAVERGIIVVNAAGNEQSDGDTSLSAPADVEGVIAVGSVSASGQLSHFSSLGPNALGQFKPDVVAPGELIPLPDFFDPTSIRYSSIRSGTSFAAPFVAGVCALIRQCFPDSTDKQVSRNLYRYCRFLPGQTARDNRYGHGLPDALRSCMQREDEVLLTASDTGNGPVAGAVLIDSKGDTIGRTAADGIAIFRFSGVTPGMVDMHYQNGIRRVSIDSTPCRKSVAPCSLLCTVRNDRDLPIPFVTVWYRSGNVERTVTSDTLGTVAIAGFFPDPVLIAASKAGYLPSDTVPSMLGEQSLSVVIRLKAAQRPLFELYPTVLRRSRHKSLIIRFAPDNGVSTVDRPALAAIRTINGELVWQTSFIAGETPVTLRWDGKGAGASRVAPGTYFLLLSSNGTTCRKKFIIAE